MTLEDDIQKYCVEFNIPSEYFFEILNDQKVLPMIRGKASEYNAYLAIRGVLQGTEWVVNKLNLNPQTNTDDQDISITHRRTGMPLKVETKNAVRESFKSGVRARLCKEPHFRVKCHRSRSNIRLSGNTNDRYSEDCFDVVISNVSNAVIKGNTIGGSLELLRDRELLEILKSHYEIEREDQILVSAHKDWRFAFSMQISEDGFVPRTPIVKLLEDPNWYTLNLLEDKLLAYIKSIRSRR
jgi:hypothetical protein